MAEIICRQADSEFNCLMTAQGMEDASCHVFSITARGVQRPTTWTLWARFHPTETTIEDIDTSIKRRLSITLQQD
jgi:hypothetical protein